MKKILKSGGYCSDGCQWRFCSFWETYEITSQFTEDQKVITGYGHKCNLFNLELGQDGSAVCCNKIYGYNYEGRP